MKQCIIVILLFSLLNMIFPNEPLILKEYRLFPYDELYMEFEYDIEKKLYISDELSEGIYYYHISNNILTIYYYPRGIIIQNANERIKWPPLLRLIHPQEILAFRINLTKILPELDIDISQIALIICDYGFNLTNDTEQAYLYPEKVDNKVSITSVPFILKKTTAGNWEVAGTGKK